MIYMYLSYVFSNLPAFLFSIPKFTLARMNEVKLLRNDQTTLFGPGFTLPVCGGMG
jgi:hypothetical protein